MFQIRKKFRFQAAHVLEDSYSEGCRFLHGHSYTCEVFLKSEELDSTGVVIDFKKIKEELQILIEQMDHACFLKSTSKFADKLPPTKIFWMDSNPTAENMAAFIYKFAKIKIPMVSKVRVHETESGFAEFWEEE